MKCVDVGHFSKKKKQSLCGKKHISLSIDLWNEQIWTVFFDLSFLFRKTGEKNKELKNQKKKTVVIKCTLNSAFGKNETFSIFSETWFQWYQAQGLTAVFRGYLPMAITRTPHTRLRMSTVHKHRSMHNGKHFRTIPLLHIDTHTQAEHTESWPKSFAEDTKKQNKRNKTNRTNKFLETNQNVQQKRYFAEKNVQ